MTPRLSKLSICQAYKEFLLHESSMDGLTEASEKSLFQQGLSWSGRETVFAKTRTLSKQPWDDPNNRCETTFFCKFLKLEVLVIMALKFTAQSIVEATIPELYTDDGNTSFLSCWCCILKAILKFSIQSSAYWTKALMSKSVHVI